MLPDLSSPRWPGHLGAVLLGLTTLPAGITSAGAQETEPATPRRFGVPVEPGSRIFVEKSPVDTPARPDTRARDLERKLQALEEKLDRLLDNRDRPTAPNPGPRPGALGRVKPGDPSVEIEIGSDTDVPKPEAKAPEEIDLEAEVDALINRAVDPERLKRLEREFDRLVEQGIDADRMERFGHELGALIEETLDRDRLEGLGREVEDLIRRAVSPERIERFGREVETAVGRRLREEGYRPSTDAERSETEREAGRRRIEAEVRRHEALERARRDEARERLARERSRREARPDADRDPMPVEDEALNHRLRQLEERLDRVLRDMERDAKPGSPDATGRPRD